jgi:hypothetical protein
MLLLCMITKPISIALQLLFVSLQLHRKTKEFWKPHQRFQPLFLLHTSGDWEFVEACGEDATGYYKGGEKERNLITDGKLSPW